MNSDQLHEHIIEIKSTLAEIKANTQDLPARVTSLEHDRTAMRARLRLGMGLMGTIGAASSWIASHFWKS